MYSHLPVKDNLLIRLGLSLAYTCVGGLVTIGYVFALREDWDCTVGQFFLSWAAYWLYEHVNFCVLDVATAFVPMSFLTFFVITWVVINVSSNLFPYELNPGFYHWGVALPGREAYNLLIQIWSGGGYHRLYLSLPILFAWEIVFIPMACIAMVYRCNAAAKVHRKAEDEKDAIAVAAVAAARGSDACSSNEDTMKQERSHNSAMYGRNDSSMPEKDKEARAVRNAVDFEVRGNERDAAEPEYYPKVPVPFQNTLSNV